MSSVLDETLLERGENGSSRASRRVVVAAAVAGLLLSATFAGYSVGKMSGDSEMDRDLIHAKLSSIQNAHTNQTELAVVAYAKTCYGFTGGTCAQSECDPGRKATCSDLKCVCPGGCAGADGTCYSQSYTKVASKISLSPMKWPYQWLYMQSASLLSQLKVSSAPTFTFRGNQYFDIYELPGKIDGKKRFFIASNYWPTWVAAIRTTGSLLSGSVSLFGLYGVSLPHTIAPWDPQGIIVEVCKYPGGSMMIGNAPLGKRTEWAYVHHGSWFVYGWGLSQDPGDGGHWSAADENGGAVDIQGLDAC